MSEFGAPFCYTRSRTARYARMLQALTEALTLVDVEIDGERHINAHGILPAPYTLADVRVWTSEQLSLRHVQKLS
jgi:hypothetical protein